MSGARKADSRLPHGRGSASSMSSANSSSSISSSKSSRNFHFILIHINSELTKQDKKAWLFLRADDVPRCKHEDFIDNFLDFFQHMKDLDKFTEENCDELFGDLNVLKHTRLLKRVINMYDELKKELKDQELEQKMTLLRLDETYTSYEDGITITATAESFQGHMRKLPAEEGQSINPIRCTETCSSQASNEQRAYPEPVASSGQDVLAGSNFIAPALQETYITQTVSDIDISYTSSVPRSDMSVPGPLRSTDPVCETMQNLPYLRTHPESQMSQAESGHQQQQQCPPAEGQLVPPASQSPSANGHSSTHRLNLPASPNNCQVSMGSASSDKSSSVGQASSSVSIGQHSSSIHQDVQESSSIVSKTVDSSDHVAMAMEVSSSLNFNQIESLVMNSGIQVNKELNLSRHSVKDGINADCPTHKTEPVYDKEKVEEDDEEKEKCEADETMETETDEDVDNLAPIVPPFEEESLDSSMGDDDIPEKSEDYFKVDSSPDDAIEEKGVWPALAVAEKLRDEKKKKEEAEAAVCYDEHTGIEKNLYDKMINKPEELTPKERELITKQMNQHLQKKAAPPKKEKSGVAFDPDGKLKEYHKELAQPGLMGFNYIMCSPTRTGKVLTAAAVCDFQRREALLKDVSKLYKALFITDGSSVKERHRIAFEEIFPSGTVAVLDNTMKFKEVIARSDISVLMLPAARLADALTAGDLSFTNVNMMVIDECHLTALGHASYCEITKHYLAEKKAVLARKAPRGAWTLGRPYGGISNIIGLTPHLGAGMRYFSRDLIVKQCGVLDSKGIRRVETVEHLRSLLQENKPSEMDHMLQTLPVSSSSTNPNHSSFRSVVEKMMSAMEQKFSILPDSAQEATAAIRQQQQQPHPAYGSEDYLTWLHPQLTEARNCSDTERSVPMAFLARLNEALMVNEDLRSREALAYLREIQEELQRDPACSGQTGTTCSRMVDEQLPELKRLSQLEAPGLTPKLKCLAKKLVQLYTEDPTMTGVVLVRCASIGRRLVHVFNTSNMMMEKGITSQYLPGPGLDRAGPGLDGAEDIAEIMRSQNIVLNSVTEGNANLLISPDFEQTSLALPRCDFVIRYNLVSDRMGVVQWKARTMAREGQCFFITDHGSKVAQRELRRREELGELEKHLKVLNEMDPKKWYDIVEDKQLACLRENAQRDFMLNYQRFCRRAPDYTLECRKCRAFICNAHYLLKRGTHVSCQDSSIKERLSIAPLTTPIPRSDDTTTGVMKCKGERDGRRCNAKLGMAVDFRRQSVEEGYGLDARAFYFSYLDGQHADYVGKEFGAWDDVDFFIQSEDRDGRRSSGMGGGGRPDDDDDNDDDDNSGGRRGRDGDGEGKKKKKESGVVGGGASVVEGGTRRLSGKRDEKEKDDDDTEKGTKKRRSEPDGDGEVDR